VRLLCCEPSAPNLVPLGQAPNAGKTQSKGRSWPSHARASSVCGQALPPNLGCAEVRLRGAEPLPHESVQADQAPQALVLEWGIEPMLHEGEPADQAPQALV